MILLDTSALIEYYRPGGDATVRAAVAEAIADDQAAVNGIIQVELLAFAAGEKERRTLESDFQAFRFLELGHEQFDLACDLGFDLRRKGVTVPATDLVIAASAITARAELRHVDGHFHRIAEVSDLEERSLAEPSSRTGSTGTARPS